MTRLWSRTLRLVSVALAMGALAVTLGLQAALASSVARPSGSVTVLAQHGFGDPQNSYAWAMGWFKGKLYVGTGRRVLCVEGATSQF